MTIDTYGNLYKVVGDGSSKVVWSSHTDTVHRMDGMQNVMVANNYAALAADETSNCLGADCTTGVFIMTEMIKAGIPGLYIFHRDEESGGKGSSRFAITHRGLLEKYDFAIAFDRRATTSVITFQGERCCSDDFAASLIEQMSSYKKDTGGTFTDTANYTHIISECTNLSVGYYNEHSKTEMQDLEHIKELLSAMLTLDQSKLVCKRDPKAPAEYPSYADFGWGRTRHYDYFDPNSDWYYTSTKSKKSSGSSAKESARVLMDKYVDDVPFDKIQANRDKLVEIIVEHPLAIAFLIEQYGLTPDDVESFIYAA